MTWIKGLDRERFPYGDQSGFAGLSRRRGNGSAHPFVRVVQYVDWAARKLVTGTKNYSPNSSGEPFPDAALVGTGLHFDLQRCIYSGAGGKTSVGARKAGPRMLVGNMVCASAAHRY